MSYVLVAENRTRMIACFQIDGEGELIELPITNMYDADGDDTEDWAEAKSYVCGSGDLWITMRVTKRVAPTFH